MMENSNNTANTPLEQLIEMTAEILEPTKICCPLCKNDFCADISTVWKEHKMSISFDLDDGHRLGVEEFSGTLRALSKAIKAMARDMGFKCEVLITDLICTDKKVRATVCAGRIRSSKA